MNVIDRRFLDRLRWFDQEKMPADLLARMEKARAEVSAELRGRELRERVDAWLEKNLSEADRRWKGTVARPSEPQPLTRRSWP